MIKSLLQRGMQFLKVSVDLQGCLPENRLYARPLSYNHRKVCITVNLININVESEEIIFLDDMKHDQTNCMSIST